MDTREFPSDAHRPWPLPRLPWVMSQTWRDQLFIHWPVRQAALRPLVPRELDIDLHNGMAWVGLSPFRMEEVHFRYLPPFPGTGEFLELNLRTYVVADGKPGVWFLSIDAGSPLAVAAARSLLGLPYHRAAMLMRRLRNGFEFQSFRDEEDAPQAEFRARYRARGEKFFAQAGTLEEFLAERYCLYTRTVAGIMRVPIHHAPWKLQKADAVVEEDTMLEAAGVASPRSKPHLMFAEEQQAYVWLPERAALAAAAPRRRVAR